MMLLIAITCLMIGAFFGMALMACLSIDRVNREREHNRKVDKPSTYEGRNP